MNPHWEMKPLEGLGELRFGDPPDALEARRAAYGDLESRGPVRADAALAEETFRMPGMGFSEAEIAELMAAMQTEHEAVADLEVQIYDTGAHFTFEAGSLAEIMMDARAFRLHVGGTLVFQTDPFPALRALQRLNAEPPLVNGPDCYFRNLHVTAFEFGLLTEGGRLRATASGTDEALQKTISWRADPRQPDEDFSGHVAVDLG